MLGIEVALEENVERAPRALGAPRRAVETVLEDPARAIGAWRQRLEDEPSDERALIALERLYERTEAYRELVRDACARASKARRPPRRAGALMTKIAETLADKLDDKPEAILACRAVLEEFGPERDACSPRSRRLYEATERYADLAETLDVDPRPLRRARGRIEVLARLGEVRRVHQKDWQGALEAFRQALTIDPSHPASRAGHREAARGARRAARSGRNAAPALRSGRATTSDC